MPSQTIEIKRHCRSLPEKEMDEVVDLVADLIVNFLKTRSGNVAPNGGMQSGKEEARRSVPQAIGNER